MWFTKKKMGDSRESRGYLADKSSGYDLEEIRKLPHNLVMTFIFGTHEESEDALKNIHVVEKFRKRPLCEASREWLYDQRQHHLTELNLTRKERK